MAYVNVLDWKAEQVADWLRGLDDVVLPYAHFFLNNDVTGQRLLSMTVDDLYKLHVEKLGHQEIILESLELLRNFHYNLVGSWEPDGLGSPSKAIHSEDPPCWNPPIYLQRLNC